MLAAMIKFRSPCCNAPSMIPDETVAMARKIGGRLYLRCGLSAEPRTLCWWIELASGACGDPFVADAATREPIVAHSWVVAVSRLI
jgi:hypothetical protein